MNSRRIRCVCTQNVKRPRIAVFFLNTNYTNCTNVFSSDDNHLMIALFENKGWFYFEVPLRVYFQDTSKENKFFIWKVFLFIREISEIRVRINSPRGRCDVASGRV